MEENLKQLLLKYLCMSLPYKVIIEYNNDSCVETREMGLGSLHDFMVDNAEIKPYLLPMSSMTEEHKEQLKTLYDAENVTNESICFLEGGTLEEYEAEIPFVFCYCVIEWLLKNHFDFMGLIPKDLAIEVTETNNPYNE